LGGGLIGVDAAERLVLDCYWLARWYHQSPEHFLAMPLSDIRRHVLRTHQMTQEIERADDDG
jgi:hypothetical protein